MDTNETQNERPMEPFTQVSGYPVGVCRLVVEAEVRYWEDADLDGQDDINGKMPLRDGLLWKPVIDLASGVVMGWPVGHTAYIHYKVCDGGEYWLADANGVRLYKYNGHYVPDSFLCHGDEGYGDYIIFSIGEHGGIVGWKTPWFNPKHWTRLDNHSVIRQPSDSDNIHQKPTDGN